MKVRQLLMRSDAIVGLVRDFKKMLGRFHKHAELVAHDRRIMDYLVSHETRKLQIGAGSTAFVGWLCTDIAPRSDEVAYLDATKPFPFEENIFHYVFSEHMIKHIAWQEASLMLRECNRILRPGGTIRIATPDLKIILGLYNHPEDPPNDNYIKWITDRFFSPKGSVFTRPPLLLTTRLVLPGDINSCTMANCWEWLRKKPGSRISSDVLPRNRMMRILEE